MTLDEIIVWFDPSTFDWPRTALAIAGVIVGVSVFGWLRNLTEMTVDFQERQGADYKGWQAACEVDDDEDDDS